MFKKLFFDHTKKVNETYIKHGWFALSFAGKLLFAAIAAIIHAFIPALFEKTASRTVAELYAKTHNRG